MRTSRICALASPFFVLQLVMSTETTAQPRHYDTPGTGDQTSVTILTDIDSSAVFVNGEQKGLTPLSLHDLRPGTYYLVLQHPDANSWLTNSISDSMRVVSGEPLTLRYKFESRYLIQSVPFDAEVVLADSILGKTPLTLAAGPSMLLGPNTTFTIRKPGYEAASLDIGKTRHGVLSVSLRKAWDASKDQETTFRANNGQFSEPLRLTLTLAGTVLSGTAAAYFKIRADGRYLEYRNSGNPDLLAQSQRLDTAAAIAFVATQIGLGLFTYFVLSD